MLRIDHVITPRFVVEDAPQMFRARPCMLEDGFDPGAACEPLPPADPPSEVDAVRARLVVTYGPEAGVVFDESLAHELENLDEAAAITRAEIVVAAVFTEPDFIPGWRRWAEGTGHSRTENLEGIDAYLAQRANIARAAYHDGLDPIAWLNDESFFGLMFSESRWDPTDTNPNSSASGIGQLVQAMWAAHMAPEIEVGIVDGDVRTVAADAATDPSMAMWQLVGAMRYIQASYRTPTNAYNFFKATVYPDGPRRDAAYAALSPGLQQKADAWRANGWGGY